MNRIAWLWFSGFMAGNAVRAVIEHNWTGVLIYVLGSLGGFGLGVQKEDR